MIQVTIFFLFRICELGNWIYPLYLVIESYVSQTNVNFSAQFIDRFINALVTLLLFPSLPALPFGSKSKGKLGTDGDMFAEQKPPPKPAPLPSEGLACLGHLTPRHASLKWTRNQIVFTIFRSIWIQTDVRLDSNRLENGKYNLIPGSFRASVSWRDGRSLQSPQWCRDTPASLPALQPYGGGVSWRCFWGRVCVCMWLWKHYNILE